MASDDSIVLRLEDVHKQYESADRDPVPVLHGISLTIRRGDSLAVVGPSAAAKAPCSTSSARSTPPLAAASSWTAKNSRTSPSRNSPPFATKRSASFFSRTICCRNVPCLENVLIPTLANTGRAPADAAEHARQLLERIGLEHRLTHRPAQLSGGECQRVAVVRSLINRPSLILADEPTGALDHSTAESLGNLLVELNRDDQVTLIVVTHSAELAAKMGAIRQLLDGRFVADNL